MKKLIVLPDAYLDLCEEVLRSKEPAYLHGIFYILLAIMVFVTGIVCFGKLDDVVRADGIVRPEKNVSVVRVFSGGEVKQVYFKPGQSVKKGEKLVELDSEGLLNKEKVLLLKKNDYLEKKLSLELIIEAFEKGQKSVSCVNESLEARFDAFVAQRDVLLEKMSMMKSLYEEEKMLPDSATTKAEVRERFFQLSLAELEKKQFDSNFKSEIRSELEELKIGLEEIEQNLKQVELDLKNCFLLSPLDGIVHEIKGINPGDYVFPDEEVLKVIPEEKKYRVELMVPASNMGKIEPGQKVKFRFPAFPFSEFRGIEGRISVIQPDCDYSSNGSLFFTVYADVDSIFLKNKKKHEYLIKNGYEVNARIVLERKNVIQFLMKKMDFTF